MNVRLSSTRMCPLCGGLPVSVGERRSLVFGEVFAFGVCKVCDLGLVLDPRIDFHAIYDAAYYAGKGADPFVDYANEAADQGRILEYIGLEAAGRRLLDEGQPLRWLDFGAGMGGFVEFLRNNGWDAWGIDEGFSQTHLERRGLGKPRLGQEFSIVSAVEVAEHLVDPVPVIKKMGSFLAPGGSLMITTGNMAKAPSLTKWTYASVPEVHITFWTPNSWRKALALANLEPGLPARFGPEVTQYKILKNLPWARRALWVTREAWKPLARLVAKAYGVSDFPIGRKT